MKTPKKPGVKKAERTYNGKTKTITLQPSSKKDAFKKGGIVKRKRK